MARIVMLLGSLRKSGNTALLAKAFLDGAKINNDVEIVSLADYKVNPCTGCNACRKNEKIACCQHDDMQTIYEKLSEADILVIASPVYFYGLSARLKAVVDRLHSPIRKTFKIKRLALLLVAADTIPTVFDSIKVQYQSVLDYFNLESTGEIYVSGVEDIGDIKGNTALEDAYALGKSIK